MDSENYKKSEGTSGIQGQLYETKLISLINFRLIHDERVNQFSLASNKNDIGAFDDICFKANLEKVDKPLTVLIQAKHRENNKRQSKTDLAKHFKSYLKIRRAFEQSSNDMIFGGKFDETECFFVIYTTAKGDPNNKIYEGSFADYLNELIGTGGSCRQPSYTDEKLDFLCNLVMKEQIIQLAKFICNKSDSVKWMSDDLIFRYHVILAHNVLHVSEIQPEGHRIASFRQDFFTTNEEFLVLFKNILCLEVLKKRKLEETDVESLLLKFLSEPSEVKILSKLLGSVLTYKNSKLKFVIKSTDDQKRQLDKANVSQSTIYEAAELAAKEYLLSLKFKVPASFGNKDLTIGGKPDKVEKELKYLTLKIIKILKQSKLNKIVTIDESLGKGFLKLNGGIASAVGNILVFDESSKLLKFTDNCESLCNLAKTCYDSLKSEIENLHEYKLDVKVRKFPILSFEPGEYDASLVRDFYDKLLFYTNQADQNGVEEILRREIKDHPCNEVNSFRDRSDVIFLKYHDEIQKLWMKPKMGSYLTKKSKIYQNAVTDAMREPLMGVLNIMHKIRNKNYTFNENAMKSFELHGQIIGTVIPTESCELTVAKVEQYLGNKDRVVLDLEFIIKLPFENYITLCKGLTNTSNEKILIIVCHNFKDSKNSGIRLENIAKAVDGKQIIIITNKNSVTIMTQYFSKASNVLNYERAVFTDLSVASQKQFLETSKIKVQGEDVSLTDIIGHDEAVRIIDEDVFNKLINNETIEIGDMAIYDNYEKQFYIDRRVSRTKNQKHANFEDDAKDKILKTFYDLEDDVVIITGDPRSGVTTLLTHLSHKTKELDPKVWIVRIKLPEQLRMIGKSSKYFPIHCENTLNTLESLKFMCHSALGEKSYERRKRVLIELDESPNGTVSLKKCSGVKSTVFQLKMLLHFYNTGKLIFLFDGFEEFVGQFKTAVVSLLKLVRNNPRKHKIWITSNPYYPAISDLEQEFGPSYELVEKFSHLEQDTYLNTFWKFNIQLGNVSFLTRDFEELQSFFAPDPNNKNQNPNLRGYMLLLEFLKMESAAAGIDFPYDKYYNDFMRSLGLCDSTISRFPENLKPWHLRPLAKTFQDLFFKPLATEALDETWTSATLAFQGFYHFPDERNTFN